MAGKVGNVGCGSVGIEGNGGSVGLGKFGREVRGGNCRNWRAVSPSENDKAMKRAKIKQLNLAIFLLSYKASMNL